MRQWPIASPTRCSASSAEPNTFNGLGPRATAEFLAEIAERIDAWETILAALEQYERRLTTTMLTASGGDRFPPLPVRQVA